LFRPPFVEIVRFHVTYEKFREALKARGKNDNNVMTLWTNEFNHVCFEASIHGINVLKKFAFNVVYMVSFVGPRWWTRGGE